ncbi:hypothetical protein vseg_011316 [Gypsophila vaccaria]
MAQAKPTEVLKVFNDQQAFSDALKSVEAESSQQTDSLVTSVYNATKKQVSPNEIHFWRGKPFSFPDVRSGAAVILALLSGYPEGAKFGIEFVDGPDNSARKFVIAVDTEAAKVYAKSGPVGPVDWNVVEVELGLGSSEAEYVDHILGGKVVANVKGNLTQATFSN